MLNIGDLLECNCDIRRDRKVFTRKRFIFIKYLFCDQRLC